MPDNNNCTIDYEPHALRIDTFGTLKGNFLLYNGYLLELLFQTNILVLP